jgi:16S rRNA C1402 (ribose-2'-O) methylase RsmI
MSRTDCRSPRGVAIAMIDTINFLCRELYKKRENLKSKAVEEAIKDLQEDEHASHILKLLTEHRK